jgi:hypothetical protein
MGTGEIANGKYRYCRNVHLPFAGITLFRFNGYYLSLLRTCERKHPEE